MRWIIGDIHGMLAPLETIIAAVHRRDWNPHFIFAGDYVNRGPSSRGVIDRLLKLPHASFVRGNHDDIFDVVLNNDCYIYHESGQTPLEAFKWFSQYGLDKTFESYGVDVPTLQHAISRPTTARLDKLIDAVPAEHKKFIRSLPALVEFDDLFVIHATWEPAFADDDIAQRLDIDPASRQRALWGRYTLDQIRAPKPWKRTGYFGHSPVRNYDAGALFPISGPQIVLIDTGAALGPPGRLSAVCAETGVLLQAEPSGKLVLA